MQHDHIREAGKLSKLAHDAWLEAMRAKDDDARADAMRRGDDTWLEAEQNLRLAGVYGENLEDEEREILLTDPCFTLAGNHASSVEQDIDFKPLRHAYFVSLVVKAVNVAALAILVFGAGALYGYRMGADDPHLTAADLERIEKHLNEGGAK